jgi:hypothetical protein
MSVVSGHPDVACAIPAMVTADPDPARMGGRRRDFANRRWRGPDAHDDLCAGGETARKKHSSNGCKYLLFHDLLLLTEELSSF